MATPLPERDADPSAAYRKRPRWLNGLLLVGIVLAGFIGIILMLILMGLVFQPIPLLIFGGAGAFLVGLRDQRHAMAMRALPTTRTGSAAIGLVELEGVARAPSALPSPFCGRMCIAFDVKVEAYDTRGDESRWYELAHRELALPPLIELEDATGRMPIWTRGADVILTEQRFESDKPGPQLPDPCQTWLAGLGLDWQSGRRLRLTERKLLEGGPLYAIGTIEERRTIGDRCAAMGERADPAGWTRRRLSAEPLLRLLPDKVGKFFRVLLGLFGAGDMLDRDSLIMPDAARPPPLPAATVLLWHGAPGRPFILSDRDAHAALASVAGRSRYWTLGGASAIVAGVIWLLWELS